eukprot:13272922-Alexandrium_andersonii.AAC.1
MSASLVGSEMCIRDSPNTPRTSNDWCLPRGAQWCGPSEGLRRGGNVLFPCLLYTSDAADDM